MGNCGSKDEIWFYLVSEGKKKPYKRMGPFRFEAIAQVYKEEQIDGETYVWTNAKFTDPKNRRKHYYMDGWKKIKDMPTEFHGRLNKTIAYVPDRRTQPNSKSHTGIVTGYDHVTSPAMPT